MGAKFYIDIPATVNRFSPKFTAAQKWLDGQVMADCVPYVPMLTGNLFESGTRGTVLGEGQIIYNAPYAKSCYYAVNRKFSKAAHPQACSQWFEKAKAAKVKAWESGVNKIMKE